MDLTQLLDIIGKIIDFSGVIIILLGLLISSIDFILNVIEKKDNSYKNYRENLGKVILLGLEFLIAGDIIRSVANTPTLSDAATLAIIVIIRTLLSVTLEMEISGKFPWAKKTFL